MKRYLLLFSLLWATFCGSGMSAHSATIQVVSSSVVTPQTASNYSFSKGDTGIPLAIFSDTSHLYRILTTRPGRTFTTNATNLQRMEAKWHLYYSHKPSYSKSPAPSILRLIAHYRFVVSCSSYVVALRHLLC